MASQQFANSAQRAFAAAVAARLPPAGVEQHKLDRLLELRAVIDSLRAQRQEDPLLHACGVSSSSD